MDRGTASMTGRLSRDPQFFGEGDSRRAVFTVAYNRGRGEKRKGNFIDCIAWGRLAECLEHFKKGSGLHVEGQLEQDTYEDKEGNKRNRVQVNIDVITATTSFGDRSEGAANGGQEVTIGGDGETADIPF